MPKKVLIIGGGVAGLEAAKHLNSLGIHVILIEKEAMVGGHLLKWDHLFPNRRPAEEVMNYLIDGMSKEIEVLLSTEIKGICRKTDGFSVILNNDRDIPCDAILLATGFNLFDARKKEEYGYGIYDNVITSAELEEFLKKHRQSGLFDGVRSKRIGFVHCVGSRDEKAGNLYCSKLCCVTGVKQAIELKEYAPDSSIFCFYMDLRMYDRNFEEMYYEAQDKWGIQFIRGRLSEASENPDQTILVKVEDTLTGLPLKMTVDLLVLLIGVVPRAETKKIAELLGIQLGSDGFVFPSDVHIASNRTNIPGVFLCGMLKGPSSVENTLADARAASLQIAGYLRNFSN